MYFFRRLFMLAFMLMMIAAGAVLIAISLNVVSPEQWAGVIGQATATLTAQASVGAVGGLFVLIGLVAPYMQAKQLKKKRIIAFQNPDGEVTVSLTAIEEYIQKIAKGIPGIRDVRSQVEIDRKGIDITIDVSLVSGANIPQVTETIQMEVRNKVQSMLGVEEKISIKMHIKKIMRGAGEMAEPEEAETAHIPFRG
jgi:uncharacterized alkaline shock family protein YloU